MKKRILSFAMAIVMICAMLPAVTPQVNAAMYNATDAVAYANAHWSDGKGLCAEFVSDCLAAGGITIPNVASYYSYSTPSYNNNSGTLGWYTNPYTCAASLLLYLSEYYTVVTNPSIAQIEVGDVVFMYGGEWRDGHVGIVIAADSEPIYAAHNRATNSGRFYSDYPCTYVVKMDGATSVTPKRTTITEKAYYYKEGESATISWSAVSGTSYYWISIWKEGELIVNQTMNMKTSYTMKDLEKGEYKFAVSANNSAGNSGGASFSFRVGMPPEKTTVETDQQAYTVGDTVTATWSAETGTTYYWINVYKDGEMIVNKSMGTSTTYTMEKAEQGEYKIAVSANNGAGNSGGSSVSFSVSPIDTPVISATKTNYKVGNKVEISWDAVDGATEYVYYLSEYPNEYAYTTNVASGRVTTTSVTFDDLPNGKYRIFVCSVSATGKNSSQSNWLTFYVYDTDYVPVKTVERDGHIYALFDEEMSWDFAKQLCEEMGGHLATVTSDKENALITELIGYGDRDAYWLGANNVVAGSYKTMGGPFQWITGEAFEYTNWKSGEPSQSGTKASLEHFLEVRKSYDNKWNDTSNTNRKNKGFILEVDTTDFASVANASYGNSKYLLFDNSVPWAVAQAYCEALGGHLVSVSSAEEDAAVGDLVKQGQKDWYFIGASKTSGEWLWADTNMPISQGYTNWSDSSSWGNYLMKYKGSGKWIGIHNFYSPGSNMTRMGFVCELENQIFSVSYDANGGSGAPESQTKAHNVPLTISSVEPNRPGYTFLGWSKSNKATEPEILPGDTFTANGDYTLYAVWQKGCADEKHSFGKYVSNGNATCIEDGTKTAKCELCDATDTKTDVGSKLGHSFTNYVSDGNATCTADGTKTAKCDRCAVTDTKSDIGSALDHTYNQKVTTDTYKAADATYSSPATYYYSCVCGAKGTETFTYGSALESGAHCELYADETKLVRGEIFTVTVKLTNSEKVRLGTVVLSFDDAVFELISGECLVKNTVLDTVSIPDRAGTFLLETEDVVCGDILVFTMKVKEDASFGIAEIDQKAAVGIEEGNYIAATGTSVEIVEEKYIKGDVDGNDKVSSDDVVALLLYISMPDMFPLPVGVSADFTGDSVVTTDDAVKLLLHISMPDMFPL